MTPPLTEQELLLLAHHRDMVDNGRYGDLVVMYKAGEPVEIKKAERILLKSDNGRGPKK